MRLNRLRELTSSELRWRVGSAWRTATEGVAAIAPPRWNRRRLRNALASGVLTEDLRKLIDAERWIDVHRLLTQRIVNRAARYVLDPRAIATLRETALARWPDATRDATERAERMLDGRYDVFGYRGLTFRNLDHSIDWHFDPVHRRRAPEAFWARVPYLDSRVGDHKVIWELNRHQHWMRLGRAFLLTGEEKYREAILTELGSWLRSNPPLVGINWASMLEVGLRCMSWTWVLHCLIGGERSETRGQEDTETWLVDILVGLNRQLTHVERHLSYYFSPNTHLTGEALALYVVGTALPEFADSTRWADTGRRILVAEIDRQILPDGGHVERSTHYQRYTLDFYLLACLTARVVDDEESARLFGDAALRLAEFTRTIADDTGRLPLIGDDDGGMLWPLTGRRCNDVRDSLSLAAALFDRPDLAPWGLMEEALWVGGPALCSEAPEDSLYKASAGGAFRRPETKLLESRLLGETGYFVARNRRGDHAVIDVGRHGYMNGGHAHADALAITLSVAGRPVLIDTGTATYTVDPALRDRMRATVSHNTVTLDGRSQSIPAGPFHWQTQAHAQVHGWFRDAAFDWIEASHDGYESVRHRRTLMRTSDDGWLIADEILNNKGHEGHKGHKGHKERVGRYKAATSWHFDPNWDVEAIAPGTLHLTHTDGTTLWLLHDPGGLELLRGDERTGLGWCAPVYGTLIPTWSARMTYDAVTPFTILTWIGSSVSTPLLTRLQQHEVEPESIGVRLEHDRCSVFVLRPGTGTPPTLINPSLSGKELPLVHS